MAKENDTRDFNNPNQGFNVKTFMIAVLVAVVVIMIGIFFFVAGRGTKDVPKANKPQPNSRLGVPPQIRPAGRAA